MLGAVFGDIVGSIYEFNNIRSKEFQLFENNTRTKEKPRITDDSVMTIAIADSLLNQKDPAQAMREWGFRHIAHEFCQPLLKDGKPLNSFSHSFEEWLLNPNAEPYGSRGNGCVMRISPVPFLITDTAKAIEVGDRITCLTHNHPDSIKAVRAYITVMHSLRTGVSEKEIKNLLEQKYGYNMHRSIEEIRATNKFYFSCPKTVPEAILCALEAKDFEEAIRNAVSIGGDSDTIACMTGALAEMKYGIPINLQKKVYPFIPKAFYPILKQLYHQNRRMRYAQMTNLFLFSQKEQIHE